jgi:hypothetical protein
MSWFQTWQNEFIFAYGRRLLALRQADLFDITIICDEILSFLRHLKSEIEQFVKDTRSSTSSRPKPWPYCLFRRRSLLAVSSALF